MIKTKENTRRIYYVRGKHLYKDYKTGNVVYKVLKDVNFKVNEGEFVAVMGPSGSGKTTLLNCISRFIDHESGEILLNNKDISQLSETAVAKLRNKDLGFVFQDFMLLDGLTVLENICIPQVILGENYMIMEEKAKNLLRAFGIIDISDKYPVEISGGQKQRVAVARALINTPYLILADEPTGNLDSRSSESVIEAFIKAKHKLNATTFMVTHDSFSASYCDRVIIMKDGKVFKELESTGDRRTFLDMLLNELRELNGGESHDNE